MDLSYGEGVKLVAIYTILAYIKERWRTHGDWNTHGVVESVVICHLHYYQITILKSLLTITSQLYHCWMTSNNIKSGMLGQHGLTVPATDLYYVKKLKKKVKKRSWKLWLPYWYNFKWNNSSLVLKQSGHISFLVCRYWTRQVCEALW